MAQPAKLRINGLVSSANRVRDQIQAGIPPQDLPSVQTFVKRTLSTVEHLCSEAQQRTDQLPTPSRNAYIYLKSLDLSTLPTSEQATSIHRTVHVPKIKTLQQSLQTEISTLALSSQWPTVDLYPLQAQLQASLNGVETHCQQAKLTPGHLSSQSRSTYAWMKRLQEGANLANHIGAVHQLHRAVEIICQLQHRGTGFKSKGPVSSSYKRDQLTIEFINMPGLYRYRQEQDAKRIQINEGFITADESIMTALGMLIVKGKNKKVDTKLRQYSVSEEYSEILLSLDLAVETIIDTAKGQVYNLQEVFERISHDYFQGTLAPPHLAWSATHTHRKFGHYEPARHRVVLSRTLDHADVPSIVVDLVMYHELLHIKHGETWKDGRCIVHTPAFRKEERQFRHFDKADAYLTQLAMQG